MEMLRAAVVQFEHVAGDKGANFSKIEGVAREAAGEGARILALPGWCVTGCWFLRHLSGVWGRAGVGVVARAMGRRETTDGVVMRGGEGPRRRRGQAFGRGHRPGGNAFGGVGPPDGVRVGVLLCYDNHSVESVRVTGRMG